jgi:hypothetical protein
MFSISTRIEMTSTHQEAREFQTLHGRSFRWAANTVVALLAIYLLGCAILWSLDFFDLAQMPWSPHTSDWLYQIYRPLEWLRHLW